MKTADDNTTLIVDDDRGFCAALRDALGRREIKALVAHSYEDAVIEAKAWKPARAIVDLRLPDRGGLEVVSSLREINPLMRIIVLTGYANIETAVSAIKLGAMNYLTKPADVGDIIAAFEEKREAVATPSLADVQREHMRRVLAETGGNISETARRLGIDRRTLQRRLARENIGGSEEE